MIRAQLLRSAILLTLTTLHSGICIAAPDEAAHQFIDQFCIDCHAGEDASGERNFELLDMSKNTLAIRVGLQEIADQLELGAMPPTDATQPTNDQRKQQINLLTNILTEKRSQRQPVSKQSGLRRLSRREYRNTVGDLLGIDMTMFDPTRSFPGDNLSEGFDNDSTILSTSGFLLEKYLESANTCVDKAFANTATHSTQEWTFLPPFKAQPELDSRFRKVYGPRPAMILYDNPNSEPSFAAYGVLDKLPHGVPHDGIYEIRVLANALHRNTPFGNNKTFCIDLAEPFRLGVRPGDTTSDDLYHALPVQPILEEKFVADNNEQWYTFRVPLSAGFAPRFTFENGQHEARGAILNRIRSLNAEHVPDNIRSSQNFTERVLWSIKNGEIPQIRIAEVHLRGPLPAAESKARVAVCRKLYGSQQVFSSNQSDRLIQDFASSAFRRPVSEQELLQLKSFYDLRVRNGDAPIEAYKATLTNILCRPQFLYFLQDQAKQDSLANYAAAEQIAYFLTSTMPDDRLLQRAAKGELHKPAARAEEARRLLESPRNSKFVSDFLDNWLDLRSLGSMPPDTYAFRIYYQRSLESAMRQETRLFFADMIARNAPAAEILSAKHSFINRGLAALYGVNADITPEQAAEFSRVEFTNGIRGGLLGQASVLTVSANGIETSPVVRGVWMLDKVLGIRSPPPPDDVPALDPDVRNATSIRNLLERHRSSEACSQCHDKIDPLGFAWEEFDPVGQHRRAYSTGEQRTPVDSSGKLPWGGSFNNFKQFRNQLLLQKRFFVRNLTTKLLTHALGRKITPDERGDVNAIMEAVAENDYPLRDLIVEIIKSDLFWPKSS